ncbi:hypothetical protein A9Q84_14025 [Halobacteriovorax marinus]|uniref:Secreted protein n=1 Tax=Halobacteriovorax marinus TaxID=97084 RepID=A0A1Y5FEM9_9BACT|nr:hypothetical protein A9Q84_14025 [Halobacteriovorax marinus]
MKKIILCLALLLSINSFAGEKIQCFLGYESFYNQIVTGEIEFLDTESESKEDYLKSLHNSLKLLEEILERDDTHFRSLFGFEYYLYMQDRIKEMKLKGEDISLALEARDVSEEILLKELYNYNFCEGGEAQRFNTVIIEIVDKVVEQVKLARDRT